MFPSSQPNVHLVLSDAAYAPPTFNGSPTQDAERWLRRFKHYVQYRQSTEAETIQLFKLMMTDTAADWLESLPQHDRDDLESLFKAFEERFASAEIFRWKSAAAIFDRQQGQSETVDTYITDVLNLAKKVPITDARLIRFALIKGFKPNIRQHVLQSSVETLEGTIKAARVAEAAS